MVNSAIMANQLNYFIFVETDRVTIFLHELG